MIMILAFFLVFVTGFIIAGSKASWNDATKVIEQTQQESPAPNYHYIAQKEREYWGEVFHNGGAKLCECHMCLEERTPKYLGNTNHVGIAAIEYGYGITQDDEWRDRDGD